MGALDIIENYKIADAENVPICQDTEMGLKSTWRLDRCTSDRRRSCRSNYEGVRRGYDKGYLRKSVVKRSSSQRQYRDNTSGYVFIQRSCLVIKIKVTVPPKGLWQRKYEHDPYVQGFSRTSGNQGFYPGSRRNRRPESPARLWWSVLALRNLLINVRWLRKL